MMVIMIASQPAITCSNLTIKTLEQDAGVFIDNFEHILVFLLLTLNM